jgi:hypothetical protein
MAPARKRLSLYGAMRYTAVGKRARYKTALDPAPGATSSSAILNRKTDETNDAPKETVNPAATGPSPNVDPARINIGSKGKNAVLFGSAPALW